MLCHYIDTCPVVQSISLSMRNPPEMLKEYFSNVKIVVISTFMDKITQVMEWQMADSKGE